MSEIEEDLKSVKGKIKAIETLLTYHFDLKIAQDNREPVPQKINLEKEFRMYQDFEPEELKRKLDQFQDEKNLLLKSRLTSQVIPKVNCSDRLKGKGITDIDSAFHDELGFKIPLLPDDGYVEKFPEIFESGLWQYSANVNLWLQHNLIGVSEQSVISLDNAWLGILEGFLPGLSLYRDQHDPSSRPFLRPDVTAVYNGCVVFKTAAKLRELDMNDADTSLAEKFQGKAFETFPRSSRSIIGICTCESLAKIFKISYNFPLQKFESTLFPDAVYRIQHIQDRVKFLVDLLKLLKWISTVSRPVKNFHLVPNVRTKTSNNHYITWNGSSIVKEFKGKKVDLKYITQIYERRFPNVEFGEVLRITPPTIRIDRIGRRLKDAIIEGFSKQTALKHVEAGIQQLNTLGLGHGDLSVNNIFVDDAGVAFLNDLEYSAPLDFAVENERRPPNSSSVMTIAEFDRFRFDELKVAIYKL